MQHKDLDTQAAPVKWFAARDARMKSYAQSTGYTEQAKLRAERMRGALELCYIHNEVHVNYRQRFVAIKVDGAEVRRKRDLALLEADWAKEGIIKRTSAQGVIYRIPR
jgi:hypothetical protein